MGDCQKPDLSEFFPTSLRKDTLQVEEKTKNSAPIDKGRAGVKTAYLVNQFWLQAVRRLNRYRYARGCSAADHFFSVTHG
jgi:hypothetical protein